jgi:hypothetical protein
MPKLKKVLCEAFSVSPRPVKTPKNSNISRRHFLNWLFWVGVGIAGMTGCSPPNYSRLENLLQSQQWAEADEETWKLVNNSSKNIINPLPCDLLKAIDQLWLNHSQGKFGITVQTKIWQEFDRPTRLKDPASMHWGNAKWKAFSKRVGWVEIVDGSRRSVTSNDLRDPSFSPPFGFFPTSGAFDGGAVFSRIEACGL